MYPGTKCLGKCPTLQIGAGTLSSGNPANQYNLHGLATTLWSNQWLLADAPFYTFFLNDTFPPLSSNSTPFLFHFTTQLFDFGVFCMYMSLVWICMSTGCFWSMCRGVCKAFDGEDMWGEVNGKVVLLWRRKWTERCTYSMCKKILARVIRLDEWEHEKTALKDPTNYI